jgi:hypothetical protein
MPRFHCAAWTIFGVRLAPFLLCDMLRIMQSMGYEDMFEIPDLVDDEE